MSANNQNNVAKFLDTWQNNVKYFDMLRLMASLSKLFSVSDVPYLDYRLAENLFCKYYVALNDARSCTAYDARLANLGIGIKTFILNNNTSVEKIAEFNKLKEELDKYKGYDLAYKLGEFRNERMVIANSMYNVTETQYHIVGRTKGNLRIFNLPYEQVNLNNIKVTKSDSKSLHFTDDKNEYYFNRSKTVLLKRFNVPATFKDVNVNILENPFELLEKLFSETDRQVSITESKQDYIVLPLYSTRTHQVPAKSGLNQWNAKGRPRDENEVYIPVPKFIHHKYPNFFPDRETPFSLLLPDGKTILSAKLCQSDSKALMTNPNKDLGEWILRKVLHKKPGELLTMFDLEKAGIDSVCIVNTHKINEKDGTPIYSISFADNYVSYSDFIED